MVVYVLDINGNPLYPTTHFGKVRRLLNSKKAKVAKKDPFTIQLTYTPETDIQPNRLEDNLMNIVVSNSNIKPMDVVANYEKKSLEKINNTDLKELENSIVYFDTELVTEDVYNTIVKRLIDGDIDVRFYTNKPFYIKEDVIINNRICNAVLPIFSLGNNITCGYDYDKIDSDDFFNLSSVISISGRYRDKVVDSIESQLIKNDCHIDRIDCSDINEANVDNVIDLIKSYHCEMKARFSEMEKESVNNSAKLKNPPIPKILILDDVDKSLSLCIDDDFLYYLKLLSNICRATNIMIIITSETRRLMFLPTDIYNNIFTHIMTKAPEFGANTIGSILKDDDHDIESALNILNINNIKLGNTQAIFKNRDSIRIFDVRDV